MWDNVRQGLGHFTFLLMTQFECVLGYDGAVSITVNSKCWTARPCKWTV